MRGTRHTQTDTHTHTHGAMVVCVQFATDGWYSTASQLVVRTFGRQYGRRIASRVRCGCECRSIPDYRGALRSRTYTVAGVL